MDAFTTAVLHQQNYKPSAQPIRPRAVMRRILESWTFSLAVLLVTIYSLFGEDVRIATTPRNLDPIFIALSSLTFVLFAMEMALTTAVLPSYLPVPGIFSTAERRRAWAAGNIGGIATSNSSSGGGDRSDAVASSTSAPASGSAAASSSPPEPGSLRDSVVPALVRFAMKAAAVVALFSTGSFYFWLDAIATASMGVEIAQICYDDGIGFATSNLDSTQVGLTFVRAARAARAGARIGRLLRVFSLMRWVRLGKFGRYVEAWVFAICGASAGAPAVANSGGKFFDPGSHAVDSSSSSASGPGPAHAGAKQAQLQPKRASSEPPPTAAQAAGASASVFPVSVVATHETRVGAALTDLMTRRIILGVLLMVLVVPFLAYSTPDSGPDTTLRIVHSLAVAGTLDVLAAAYNTSLGRPYSPADLAWTPANSPEISAMLTQAPSSMLLLFINGTQLPLAGGVLTPPSDPSITELRQSAIQKSHYVAWLAANGSSVIFDDDGNDFEGSGIMNSGDVVYPAPGWPYAGYTSSGAAVVPVFTVAWFSLAEDQATGAQWSTGLTLLVIFTLLVGAALFSYDINRIVLRPLEHMVAVVRWISANPMASFDEQQQLLLLHQLPGGGDAGDKLQLESKTPPSANYTRASAAAAATDIASSSSSSSIPKAHCGRSDVDSRDSPAAQSGEVEVGAGRTAPASTATSSSSSGHAAALVPYDVTSSAASVEVRVLLRALLNMGSLLRMGFGDAGAAVVTANLNTAGELNLVAPGRLRHSIFVFVRVPLLRSLTSALRGDALLLLNAIAQIVHRATIAHGGTVVCNTPSGFFLTWPLNPGNPVIHCAAAPSPAAATSTSGGAAAHAQLQLGNLLATLPPGDTLGRQLQFSTSIAGGASGDTVRVPRSRGASTAAQPLSLPGIHSVRFAPSTASTLTAGQNNFNFDAASRGGGGGTVRAHLHTSAAGSAVSTASATVSTAWSRQADLALLCCIRIIVELARRSSDIVGVSPWAEAGIAASSSKAGAASHTRVLQPGAAASTAADSYTRAAASASATLQTGTATTATTAASGYDTSASAASTAASAQAPSHVVAPTTTTNGTGALSSDTHAAAPASSSSSLSSAPRVVPSTDSMLKPSVTSAPANADSYSMPAAAAAISAAARPPPLKSTSVDAKLKLRHPSPPSDSALKLKLRRPSPSTGSDSSPVSSPNSATQAHARPFASHRFRRWSTIGVTPTADVGTRRNTAAGAAAASASSNSNAAPGGAPQQQQQNGLPDPQPGHLLPFVARRRLHALYPGISGPDLVGIGLHAGWSIEGVLGSDRKLDACATGPHVSLATRLAALLDSSGGLFGDYASTAGAVPAPSASLEPLAGLAGVPPASTALESTAAAGLAPPAHATANGGRQRLLATAHFAALLSTDARSVCRRIARLRLVSQGDASCAGFEPWVVRKGPLPSVEEGARRAKAARLMRARAATAAAAAAAASTASNAAAAASTASTVAIAVGGRVVSAAPAVAEGGGVGIDATSTSSQGVTAISTSSQGAMAYTATTRQRADSENIYNASAPAQLLPVEMPPAYKALMGMSTFRASAEPHVVSRLQMQLMQQMVPLAYRPVDTSPDTNTNAHLSAGSSAVAAGVGLEPTEALPQQQRGSTVVVVSRRKAADAMPQVEQQQQQQPQLTSLPTNVSMAAGAILDVFSYDIDSLVLRAFSSPAGGLLFHHIQGSPVVPSSASSSLSLGAPPGTGTAAAAGAGAGAPPLSTSVVSPIASFGPVSDSTPIATPFGVGGGGAASSTTFASSSAAGGGGAGLRIATFFQRPSIFSTSGTATPSPLSQAATSTSVAATPSQSQADTSISSAAGRDTVSASSTSPKLPPSDAPHPPSTSSPKLPPSDAPPPPSTSSPKLPSDAPPPTTSTSTSPKLPPSSDALPLTSTSASAGNTSGGGGHATLQQHSLLSLQSPFFLSRAPPMHSSSIGKGAPVLVLSGSGPSSQLRRMPSIAESLVEQSLLAPPPLDDEFSLDANATTSASAAADLPSLAAATSVTSQLLVTSSQAAPGGKTASAAGSRDTVEIPRISSGLLPLTHDVSSSDSISSSTSHADAMGSERNSSSTTTESLQLARTRSDALLKIRPGPPSQIGGGQRQLQHATSDAPAPQLQLPRTNTSAPPPQPRPSHSSSAAAVVAGAHALSGAHTRLLLVPSCPLDPVGAYSPSVWRNDKDLRLLRRRAPPEFRLRFHAALSLVLGELSLPAPAAAGTASTSAAAIIKPLPQGLSSMFRSIRAATPAAAVGASMLVRSSVANATTSIMAGTSEEHFKLNHILRLAAAAAAATEEAAPAMQTSVSNAVTAPAAASQRLRYKAACLLFHDCVEFNGDAAALAMEEFTRIRLNDETVSGRLRDDLAGTPTYTVLRRVSL